MSNLPPLPEPFGHIRDNSGGPMVFQHKPFGEMTRMLHSTGPVYSIDQLRSYAEEAVRLEREACAMMFEDLEDVAAAIRARSQEGDGAIK